MSEPNDQSALATLAVQPDSDRPDAIETLRHPAYFGAATIPSVQEVPELDTLATPVNSSPTASPRKRSFVPLLAVAVVFLVIGTVAALVFSGYLGDRSAGGASAGPPFAVEQGELIPAFRGYLLDPSERGPLYTLDDTVGRPLVIAAWTAGDPQTPAFLRAVSNLATGEAHAVRHFSA